MYADGGKSNVPVLALRRNPHEAQRILDGLTAPASWEECSQLARQLHDECVMPSDSRGELGEVYDSRARALAEHPADIAREARRLWPRHNKFYPTVFELRELCLKLGETRRQFAHALSEAIGRLERGEDVEVDGPGNPEMRAKVGAELQALAKSLRAQCTAAEIERKAERERRQREREEQRVARKAEKEGF